MAAVGSVLVSSLLLLTSAGSAVAASISVELNRLQPIENGCRMNLVFTNRMPTPVDLLTVETVLFDQDDRVERFLLLRARDLPSGKIRVHQFDVSETSCDAIGTVLLNDVTECQGEGLDPARCLELIDLSSREDAELVSSVAVQEADDDAAVTETEAVTVPVEDGADASASDAAAE